MIPEGKDPYILELERICNNDLEIIASFVEANIFESNIELDKISDDRNLKFPVCVLVVTEAPNRYKIGETLELKRKVPVTLMLLDKYEQKTIDYKSSEVNPTINKMRMLGENLIFNINKSYLSVAAGVDDFTIDPIYNKTDANLYGVGMVFDWDISTGVSGCYH